MLIELHPHRFSTIPGTGHFDQLFGGRGMPSVVKFADVEPFLAVTEQVWTGSQSVFLSRLNTPVHLCLISKIPKNWADHLSCPCRDHNRAGKDQKTFGALVHQSFLPSQARLERQLSASPERGIASIHILESVLRTDPNRHLADCSLSQLLIRARSKRHQNEQIKTPRSSKVCDQHRTFSKDKDTRTAIPLHAIARVRQPSV